VAEAALGEGAEIVNDISAGRWDPPLWPVVAKSRAGYVLMHALAQPGTAHDAPNYADVTVEVGSFLRQFLTRAEENGFALESIVCDPGFGFGKTLNQNLTLMRDLADLPQLGRPVLVGLSRKSFLKLIGGSESLALTHELALIWAAARGATIWRVHDVPAALRAARLVAALGRGADTA
jgi:dihydropteroate synthase